MRRALSFLRENLRFAAAILANALALAASVWWLIASNWNNSGRIEIEPIVSCIALTATLLGLNFVNDKLTKPHLRVRLSMTMSRLPSGAIVNGIGVIIENHSIQKAFVNSYQIQLPRQKMTIQFLYEGFTGDPIQKRALEPGQAFSFNVVKKNLHGAPDDISEFGDFVVTTDIGYEFRVAASTVREHVLALRCTEP
jgi:hypothetical protein